jgi:hypothetical protein
MKVLNLELGHLERIGGNVVPPFNYDYQFCEG